MSGEGKAVCVTGGSGYIASWLVNFLLKHGCTVKTSVRDPNDQNKTKHLLALDGAKERLHLFKANLVEEGSFDPVVDGCEGVLHVASPVFLAANDPQADLIEPAVKGTLNVLKSCAKFPSVKRVILTSSMSSVTNNGKPLTPDVVVDETWFSDPAFCESNKTIPGAETLPSEIYRFVDVRDVAYGHVQALEIPSASGRCCLVGRVAHFSIAVKIAHEHYPTLRFTGRCADDKPFPLTYEVSKEKAKTLGIDFSPLEVSVKDTIESSREKGFLNV